jgi:hypothetical protein
MVRILQPIVFFVIVLATIAVVAGLQIAGAFFVAFVAICLALRLGYFRTVRSERFVLYDYRGRKRAELGGAMPPPGNVIGQDWDPSPGLDLYYRNGEKAATLTIEWQDGQDSVMLALYRDAGRSRLGLANTRTGQGISGANASAGTTYGLRLGNKGELSYSDASGSEKRLI